MSPRGPASPHFRHGRYSKALPAHLKTRYEAARTDEALISVREEIALVDARVQDILSKIDTDAAATRIDKIRDAFGDFLGSRGTKEEPRTIARLTRVIEQAVNEREAWRDVMEALDARRRLADTERKRLVDLRQWITAEQAQAMIVAIANSVQQHVSSEEERKQIADDLRLIMVAREVKHRAALAAPE